MQNATTTWPKHTCVCTALGGPNSWEGGGRKAGSATSRGRSEEYGEGGGRTEGVWGPRCDMMEEGDGSFQYHSPSFSSWLKDTCVCMHTRPQLKCTYTRPKGSNRAHAHNEYHPITHTYLYIALRLYFHRLCLLHLYSLVSWSLSTFPFRFLLVNLKQQWNRDQSLYTRYTTNAITLYIICCGIVTRYILANMQKHSAFTFRKATYSGLHFQLAILH